MSKRTLAALFVVLLGGAFCIAGAQRATAQQKAAPAADSGPPWFTHTAKYYGFVTCNTAARRGHSITADEIKKCVADGGRYILLGSPGGRKEIQPQEKAAEFAGRQVFMTLTVRSQRYGTGPTSDPSIEGFYAGGDRPATRVDAFTIVKIEPTEYNDAWSDVPASYWRGRPAPSEAEREIERTAPQIR